MLRITRQKKTFNPSYSSHTSFFGPKVVGGTKLPNQPVHYCAKARLDILASRSCPSILLLIASHSHAVQWLRCPQIVAD